MESLDVDTLERLEPKNYYNVLKDIVIPDDVQIVDLVWHSILKMYFCEMLSPLFCVPFRMVS